MIPPDVFDGFIIFDFHVSKPPTGHCNLSTEADITVFLRCSTDQGVKFTGLSLTSNLNTTSNLEPQPYGKGSLDKFPQSGKVKNSRWISNRQKSRKWLEIKPFHTPQPFTLDINTTVSTCLVTWKLTAFPPPQTGSPYNSFHSAGSVPAG